MKKFLIIISLIFISLFSCTEEEVNPSKKDGDSQTMIPINTSCNNGIVDFTLFAGQDIDVGRIKVTNDNVNLYVTYQVDGLWVIEETHLYVGDLEGLPVNPSSTPVTGQFPHKVEHGELSFLTYTIPLSSINGSLDCLIIAAHCTVRQLSGESNNSSETAWSYGLEFPGTNRWGWYSEYCKQPCEDNDNDNDDNDDVIIIQG